MRVAFFVGLTISVFLAGCASSGDLSLVVPTAGGGRARLPISRGGVAPSENDIVRIDAASFTLDAKSRRFAYTFAVTEKRPGVLKAIRVEDISDDKPELLLEDSAPELRDGKWHGVCAPISADDVRLKWLSTIDNTARVYRFTFTTKDGRTHVLDQGALFPGPMKSAIRRSFGGSY